MSLYDDEDLGAPPTEVAVGWSTGVKLMQSQLQVKKPKSMASNPMGPPISNSPNLMPNLKRPKSSTPILAPVIDLKTKKPLEDTLSPKYNSRSDRVRFTHCGNFMILREINFGHFIGRKIVILCSF